MPVLRFNMSLSAERYLPYYRGWVESIAVITDDGRRLHFPAEHLRRFVTHEGIYGRFEIEFDDHNRLIDLRRIE
jgi:hypothetical protein